MDKRIISLMLVVVSICSLLAGCGTQKFPSPAKPAEEVTPSAEELTASQKGKTVQSNEEKIFPNLTIDELCDLSLNEMRQLEFRGILDNLSETEQEQYLSAIKEKQAHRDELRALISKEDLALLDENMVWPLDDTLDSGTYIDCITGKIYSGLSQTSAEDALYEIYTERVTIDIYMRSSADPEGYDGFPFKSKDGLWYDFIARGEFKYPIDIYLCRLERGLLEYSSDAEKLGEYQKYSARPIEEVTTVHKTWEEVYGVFEKPWHDLVEHGNYTGLIHEEQIDGRTVALIDCLTGIRYDLENDGHGSLNELYGLIWPEREKLNLPFDENFIEPIMQEGVPFMYDPWTKAEYSQPIDMYLARKEAGLLPEILGEEAYSALDKSKMY